MEKQKIEAENNIVLNVFGSFDENIKYIEKLYGVKIVNRSGEIVLTGEKVGLASKLLEVLIHEAKKENNIDRQMIDYFSEELKETEPEKIEKISSDFICMTVAGRAIRPKTIGQLNYVDAIRKNTIVFGIGPAGTGKTYLAMAMAITAFKNHEVSRIILTRPAIEAGENLGFLPGDLQQKVDPYLRPLYDALYEIMGAETFAKNMEKGAIEVAPLAYMRGRTLDNSFIVLDEAQNTTPEQMKMFLTRIGFGSKAVITGDTTQIDLPRGKKSGLLEAAGILNDIEGISIMELTNKDVVRHPLVQKIIKAYEKYEEKRAKAERKDKEEQSRKNRGGGSYRRYRR
ncbi:MAG: PhoH family protein [Clostridiales bacterium]|nr:PhoH family protein [Clostridiales bacterium]